MFKHYLKPIIIALYCTFAFCSYTYSQWVPIHSSFANYISVQISAAAISGNMLDTTNTAVTSLQNLTISSNSQVTDITGIQYFDNLKNLITDGTNIVSIPILPPLLQSLEVRTAGSSIASPLPNTLTALKIRGGSLSSIPALPNSLTFLFVTSCTNILSLPPLPTGLQQLTVNYTSNNFIFPSLPSGLQYLDYSYTQFSAINSLPPTLYSLNVTQCPNITSITNLPSTLRKLTAWVCGITNVSGLPNTMEVLNLSSNPITVLNQLPDTIMNLQIEDLPYLQNISNLGDIYIGQYISFENCPLVDWGPWLGHIMNYDTSNALWIDASDCIISHIPQLNARYYFMDISGNPINNLSFQDTFCINGGCWHPFENLEEIYISYCNISYLEPSFFSYNNQPVNCNIYASHNNLTYLDWIPDSYSFDVSNNQLSDFPFTVLSTNTNLKNNQISCLPYIRYNVQSLSISGNPINCLPNIPNTNFACDIGNIVCQVGNSNNCPALSLAGGKIFNDLDSDGFLDTNETFLPKYLAKLSPSQNITQSDSLGRYRFQCQPNINYTMQGLPSYPYRIVTSTPHAVSFWQLGQVDTNNNNIGIHIIPNVNDLIVKITPYVEARPGFNHKYRITVKNEGTTVQNGNIVFYFDTALIYQSASVPGTNTASTITWPINNLQPLSQFTTDVQFLIPAVVPLGHHINAGAYALGNIPDTTFYDNHDTVMQIAIGSYDPNDKQVFPAQGLSQQEIIAGKYLDYLVRFQNTGTASAINIRVEDTLSAALNVNTFEMLDASHAYTWKIENNLLTVSFANIQLPDSGTDEVNSHGFFRFRIRPYINASVGDQINNTAYIYFDFNEAVITNTAHTTVSDLFIKHPQPQVLCLGEHLLLTVQTGNGIIAKQWYRNDTAINNTTDTLYVNNAALADLGEYYCQITLANGEKYNSDKVGVQIYATPTTAPTFSITGQLVYNDTLRVCNTYNTGIIQYIFSVNSEAALTYNFDWYVNDTLVGFTNPSSTYITINHIWHTGDKLAAYLVSPCNQLISVDSAYMVVDNTTDTLQLNITPSVAQICPGEEVKFKATSLNSDNTYVWKKNSVTIGSGDSIIISGLLATDKVICITNAGSAQGCPIVYNVNGNNLRFDTATVVINPTSTPQPGSGSLVLATAPFCAGTSNTISVNSYNLGTSPQYQWMVNGVVQSETNSTFTTSALNNDDVVKCRIARALCGTDTFFSAPLTLSEATSQPSINIAMTFIGTCSSSATFKSTKQNLTATNINYNWVVNGVMQGSTPGFSLSRSTEHADTIYLRANTHKPCGDSIVISNSIILPPASKNNTDFIITPSTTANVCRNYAVSFTTNRPSARWYVNGLFKNTGNSFTYLDTTDFAVQAITNASSCYDADTSNLVHVNVLSSPVVPSLQIVTNPTSYCSGQQVKLTALVSGYIQSSIIWDINGTGYSGASVIVNNLQQGTLVKSYTSLYGSCFTQNMTVADSFIVNTADHIPSVEVSTDIPLTCQPSPNNTFNITDGYYLGSFPTYEWFKNGTSVGNSTSYADNALQSGDYIYCEVTSNNPCVAYSSFTTDTFTMANGIPITPTINIAESANNVCEGTSIAISAQASNQGSTPTYQWIVNGDTMPYTGSNLPASQYQDGDIVTCTLTSSDVCASPPAAVSNPITLWVTESVTPNVSISASDSAICTGTPVSFVLENQFGGSAPSYIWKINGNVVSTSPSFSSSTLQNGDVLTVEMTTDEQCATASAVTSAPITFSVYNVPTITIAESANNVCEGTSIAISAQVSNQGSTPTYQWIVNGDTMPYSGSNLPASQYQDGDIVTCTFTSSDICASTPVAVSNPITLWVNESVTPTVSISASDSTICTGTPVSFALANQFGGSAPSYIWKINGESVSTSPSFSSSTLQNGDVLTVEMTTDEPCATASTVSSTPILFTVYNAPTKPTINQNGNVLTSSNADGNTWYYNGSPIIGANTDSYIASQTGWYAVLATNNSACSAMSDSVFVQVVSVGTVNTEDVFNVYPNPASNYVNVYISSSLLGAAINITDATGKLVFTDVMNKQLQAFNTELYAKGVYTVTVRNTDGNTKQSKLGIQ